MISLAFMPLIPSLSIEFYLLRCFAQIMQNVDQQRWLAHFGHDNLTRQGETAATITILPQDSDVQM
jgi:hypothetical protein